MLYNLHGVYDMTRKKMTVTVDPEIIEWLDEKVESKRFRNRSHAVEYYLWQQKKKEEKKES